MSCYKVAFWFISAIWEMDFVQRWRWGKKVFGQTESQRAESTNAWTQIQINFVSLLMLLTEVQLQY